MNKPNWKIVPFLALKDMLQDKGMLLLVIFILALSFLNVTFFSSFINGFGTTFENEIINTVSGHIIIEPPTDENLTYLDFESSIRKKINAIPGVVGSSPRLRVPGTIFFEDEQMSVPILGIKPSEEEYVTWVHEQLQEGEYLSDDDRGEIMLGRELAGYKEEEKVFFKRRALDVDAGEKIRIVFANGIEREFHVKAIVGKPFGDVTRSAYISFDEAQEIMNLTDEASQVLVKLKDKGLAKKYSLLITEQVLKNAEVKTWKEFLAIADIISKSYDVVVYILSFVSILIAITTITIVIYINTSRKRRHIAVLKAIGTPNKTILQIFLFESVVFGLIGVPAGMGLSYLVNYYLQLNPIITGIGPVRPELTLNLVITASLILITAIIVAGVWPAWKAAKEEILKYVRIA